MLGGVKPPSRILGRGGRKTRRRRCVRTQTGGSGRFLCLPPLALFPPPPGRSVGKNQLLATLALVVCQSATSGLLPSLESGLAVGGGLWAGLDRAGLCSRIVIVTGLQAVGVGLPESWVAGCRLVGAAPLPGGTGGPGCVQGAVPLGDSA